MSSPIGWAHTQIYPCGWWSFFLVIHVHFALVLQGEAGIDGMKGEYGPKGDQGDKGDRGVRGNEGPVGPKVSLMEIPHE